MNTLRTITAFALAATAVAAAPSVQLSDAPAPAYAGTAYAPGDGPMGSGYHEEVMFPSLDGTILHGDLLLPGPPDEAPEGGWPMIISGGPYFSAAKTVPTWNPTAVGPVERFADFIVGAEIFDNGYGWAQFDTRGYGSSQGCNDYGGHGEQADMAAAIEYFGGAPYSNGNVGLWGKSYDAWTQVMAMAMNPTHLKAAVIQAPLIEGYRLAYDNGIHWNTGWYATTSLYMLYDNQPVGPADGSPEEQVNSLQSTASADCWAANQANATAGYDRESAYWVERNLIPRAANSMVPTFWTMGFQDINTKPTNLLDVFSHLDGYHKGWFGHWDHENGRGNQVNREDFFTEVMDFLDVTLKGEAEHELDVNKAQQTRVQTNLGDWYAADDYPASDVAMFELELNSGEYTDSNSAAEDEGLWTFTEEMPHTVHFSGEPIFHVQASPQIPNANLLTRIYAIDDAGRAELISRGAMLLEQDGTTGQGSSVSFHGWPSDFVLEAGTRLGVLFTSSDVQHNPINTGGTVTITSAIVELPFRTALSVYDEYTDLAYPPYASTFSGLDFAGSTVEWTFPPETN